MVAATHPADPDRVSAFWEGRTLGSFLDEAVSRAASSLAVVEGETRLTQADLSALAGAVARGLRGLGVARGDVVTFQLPNWWEHLPLFHGTVRLGAAANPVIPIYRRHEVEFIVRQARPRVVVVPHRFRGFDYVDMITPLLESLTEPPTVVVVRPQGPLPTGFLSFTDLVANPSPFPDEAEPDDISVLLYTSGTTADPKGALHNHETLIYENRSIIDWCGLCPGERVFMASPLGHITGVLYGILLPPILSGASVLLDVWDPPAGVQLIERESCTFTVGATPFLHGLVSVHANQDRPSSLSTFLCGGADVPPELVRQAARTLDARVVRVYGSTELPTFSCGALDDPVELAAESDGWPIGPAVGRLSDARDGLGELEAWGPEMFLGYLDARLNHEAFTDDGYFRTGDLASIDARGAVTIRGRRKDIIIRGGENLSAKEIEDLLYEHPAVAEVAVVAMPDAVMGEKACAFVVPAGPTPPSLDDLAHFLTERGIARQKYPERLEVVHELPKTASGKVQKFRLRDALRSAFEAQATAGPR